MKPFILFFLFIASMLTLGKNADACQCGAQVPPCEAYSVSSAVFIGLVTDSKISYSESGTSWHYKIRVEEVFLGNMTAEIAAGSSSHACGYEFRMGRRYLIYVIGNVTDSYYVTYCSRTRPIEKADEDLMFLRNERLKLNGLRIHVKLNWDAQSFYALPKEVRTQPPGKARIKLTGQDGRYDLVTQEDGIVEVGDLGGGWYKVDIIPPEGTRIIESRSNTQTLYTNGRGCSNMTFVISNQK
jgi:hypothetical protein